jgi:tetratricopeptide (TPR) repeat protein
MKNLFGEKNDPELQARDAMRLKKWQKAIAHYEKKLQSNERDYALWNFVGDLHMNNRARAQAVEAWRRALEGYALEGLYDNVLGIARKILRRAPEEEDLNLVLAEAFLGLEYYADCLAALRSYLKLSRHRSESDMRSLFKKILDQRIPHPHLLEELDVLYKEAAIEDIELERRLHEYIEANRKLSEQHSRAVQVEEKGPEAEATEADEPANAEGLITLDGMNTFEDDTPSSYEFTEFRPNGAAPGMPESSDFEAAEGDAMGELPPGEGKDHYDLGLVYKEMALWDAAIAEFEQARHDRSVRIRATLALAECLQESRDLHRALELLEGERRNGEGSMSEQLPLIHQLGAVHELLGNLEEARHCYEMVQSRQPGYGDVEVRLASIESRLSGS